MQKQDVGHHIGPGIGAESVVGQADRPQQLGPLGQIPAHGGILGVHCVAAGDKGHHAAGAHLVQRLGKKVVVDVEAQLVVGFVVHLVLAERDVTDGKVIEVPPVGGLKARHGDVSLGVELLGNRPLMESSSTPYSLLPAMLSGSIPKNYPRRRTVPECCRRGSPSAPRPHRWRG